MNKLTLLIAGWLVFAAGAAGAEVSAQGTVAKRGPDAAVLRDPLMEKDSLHNLEVARHYFKLKKAYKAAIARCEEIIAGNPTFSKIDEVLYLAGVSSSRLADNQGKQAANLPAEKLREDARNYLSRLVDEFPESQFHDDAEVALRALGGAKEKPAPEKTEKAQQ